MEECRLTRVRFKPFYTEWWRVFPGTVFRIDRVSNSGRSVWLDMRGRGIVCVPTECLEHLDRSKVWF